MKIDKRNEHCIYNDANHIYVNENNGTKYNSVTGLLGQFHEHFNDNFWAGYKALEKMIIDWPTKQSQLMRGDKGPNWETNHFETDTNQYKELKKEILQAWENNKNEACERGTGIHLERELEILSKSSHNETNPYLDSLGLKGEFETRTDHKLDVEKGIYPEILLFSDKHNLAGQADLVVKDGNDIYIIDFKTNKELAMNNKYQKMFEPVNHLDDCSFNHYKLQLSIYGAMIEEMSPELKVKGLLIIHVPHVGIDRMYKTEYLGKEAKAILKTQEVGI